MTDNRKVVLAFSGGLDTSYCVLALRQAGYAVHTLFVDSGGVGEKERQAIRERALALGAAQHHERDCSQALWDEFVVPLVHAGARMRDEYPLLCSDRYLIVAESLALCDELGTRDFAHGCTGMGNDQLRFDQTVRSLGDYHIHAPIRTLQKQGVRVREVEQQVLAEAGIEVSASTSRYSINENLLGLTLSGEEVDAFQAPAADTWQWCQPRAQWPLGALRMDIGFERGQAVSLDGERLPGPLLLARLNQAFGAYGVGRHIYTGDVSIGLKGRIVFECPGLDVLLTAHAALEDAVNTRLQNQFRHVVAQRWVELVYTGYFHDPHKYDLEAYLSSAQRALTGTVTVETEGGVVRAVALDSAHILRDPDAVYAQSAAWSAEEAEGFIKLSGQSSTLAARLHPPLDRRRGGINSD